MALIGYPLLAALTIVLMIAPVFLAGESNDND